ncbi:hypothetical protein MVEN_00672300 [Mycena venus]|uniref:Glycosyltransferase family 69 protein n=1 Tax=Mycena venus TaxID=2733690 RepID=A0A8H6YQA3_9AGAR|nr:hypothetical protein MVEN_00672300 [Mycena venus]
MRGQALAVLHRLADLTHHARLALYPLVSRLHRLTLPRPFALLFFSLLLALLLTSLRLLWQFAHPIVSLVVLRKIWKATYAFYNTTIPVSWAPAFPYGRTAWVVSLVSVPMWGAWMAVLMVVHLLVVLCWNWARSRLGGRSRRYEPLSVDFEDLSPSSSHRRKSHSSPSPLDNVSTASYLLVWGCYLSLALFGVYMLKTYELPADHRFKPVVEQAIREPRVHGYGKGEKVFIAAMFYNNGAVLPYWINEVTKLIYYLGPRNVYISIVESNSWDNSADLLSAWDTGILAELEREGGLAKNIRVRDQSIKKPASPDTAPPRIEFLAAVRNLVMEPLVSGEARGYTKVLFSNDIFIEAESIVELLETKEGEYDMVCGLDLAYWGLYDQWVIRDRLGRFASTLWPYLLEDTGMRAVMRDEPAEVFSCWNGIVAIKADPFLPPTLRSGQLSTAPLERPLVPTHPAYNITKANPLISPAEMPAVKFRMNMDGECFSSESFLLPYDLRRQFGMERIYVNPKVINGYSWEWYVWFKYITRHWAVKWYIEKIENGNGVHLAKMILGDPARVTVWDGGECHPW